MPRPKHRAHYVEGRRFENPAHARAFAQLLADEMALPITVTQTPTKDLTAFAKRTGETFEPRPCECEHCLDRSDLIALNTARAEEKRINAA